MVASLFVYIHSLFWLFVAICCILSKLEVAAANRKHEAEGYRPQPDDDTNVTILLLAMLVFSIISCYQVS